MIWLLCVHWPSHSFARTWTEKRICKSKNWWLDFVTMLTCSWAVFTGAARGAEHCTARAGALESGTGALTVLFENAGNVLPVAMCQYDYSFGAKGRGVLPKWGDRELSVEMAHDLQANTKENCVLFMWWMSLVLCMAPSVSLLGTLTVYKAEVGVLGREWGASTLKSAKLYPKRLIPIASLIYVLVGRQGEKE